MYYIIYKITNKVNRKIYVGKHKTVNLNDSYMGSGKNISRAILKYGIENFEKEILFLFDNELEMNQKEAELVNEDFCLRKDTYNIALGGNGGWDVEKSRTAFLGKRHTQETKNKISDSNKQRLVSEETKDKLKICNKMTETRREKISKAFKGLNKTEEHKKNLSESLKKYYNSEDYKNIGRIKKCAKKQVIKCPNCSKEGSPNNMKRWHFDNCKTLLV